LDEGKIMAHLTTVGRVMVPVVDQDAAIAFYIQALGFSLIADVPFGDGERWVEVAPPGGGTTLALVPPSDHYPAGRMTGIALGASDARAAHADLRAHGVDVDDALMGGEGGVPLIFFFRDADGNQLMTVEDTAPPA
jgi:catechol 2,3-dioxygenase-like lactoylglutathione lyase family enzyme